MSNETKEIRAVVEGIDLISTGLLILDQHQPELINFGGPKIVDITARMNAQYTALEKLIRPLKENIKAAGLNTRSGTVRGEVYQADVSSEMETILDIEKVKKFLARQLPQFQKRENKVDVSFTTKV